MDYFHVKYIGDAPELAEVRGATGIAMWDLESDGYAIVQFDDVWPWSHKWTKIHMKDLTVVVDY